MIERFSKNARASGVVVSNGFIETAGIVAAPGTSLDIKDQTRSVLAQLEDLLAQVGAGKSNITRIQIWLADMADFAAMNEVYDNWVANSDQPARACVGASLASPDYRIEIQANGAV